MKEMNTKEMNTKERINCLLHNNLPDNKKKLIFIFTLNMLLVLAVLRFFCPVYEENDDFAMSCIASGVYGTEYMQYLIYSNIIYGYFLKFLGLVFEGVNWYVVMQYILLTIAVTAIFYCLSFHLPFHIVVFANMLFWYAGFFEHIRRMQFTRTASVLSIAGFILIWNGCIISEKFQKISGIILCILGSCVRPDCFWACLGLFAALFFFLSFSGNGFQKGMFQKYFTMLFAVLCIVGLFKTVDHICYLADEDWAYYRNYNAVRSELLDYGFPNYETNKERYEELGFTQNDLRILGGWILEDTEKFCYDNLSKIASWKEKPRFQISQIKLYLKNFLAGKHSTILFDIWIALLIACFLKNNVGRFFAIANICLFMGEYFYLYYIGRVLPRVEYGIMLSAVFSLAVCWCGFYQKKDYDRQFRRKMIAGILAFSLLFLRNDYVVHYRDYDTGAADKYWETQGRIAEKLAANTDCVYVLNIISFLWTCQYGKPYEEPPTWFLSNFCYTGGWYVRTPFNEKLHDRLGLDNPMKDLLYKDNVYYVRAAGDGIDAELLFLQENYKPDAQVRVVDSIEGCNVYEFY